MENSKIEWTNHTANLWWGCTEVHEGCSNCYAVAFAHRYNHDIWGNDKPRKEVKSVWKELEKFQKQALEAGEIHLVFVGSMMDIFEKSMPLVNWKGEEYSEGNSLYWTTGMLRDKFFNEVVPNSPNLMFLLLTKRPSNINKYIPGSWKENPPTNVMFGTSPVNQETADNLIVQLSKVNGKRFLSVEPQLGAVDLMKAVIDGEDSEKVLLDLVDWVIVGGESGHHKRPYNTDWARQIREDCKVKNVPFFFKQIDKVQAIPDDLFIKEFPPSVTPRFIEKVTNPKIKMEENVIIKVQENEGVGSFSNRKLAEEYVDSLSPFKKEIGLAILSGITPAEVAIKFSTERNKPLKTYQAYVTMVTNGLENIIGSIKRLGAGKRAAMTKSMNVASVKIIESPANKFESYF